MWVWLKNEDDSTLAVEKLPVCWWSVCDNDQCDSFSHAPRYGRIDRMTDPWRVNRRSSPLICSTLITCSQYDIDRRINVPWNAIIEYAGCSLSTAVVITTVMATQLFYTAFLNRKRSSAVWRENARRYKVTLVVKYHCFRRSFIVIL